MIKMPVTFPDLDNNTRTVDFWFHMSKTDIADWVVSHKMSLEDQIRDIVKREDNEALFALFRELIEVSYGERHANGITFNKSKELSRNFVQSNAYSELFVLLMKDEAVASKFVRGIMPSDIASQMPEDLPSLEEIADGIKTEGVKSLIGDGAFDGDVIITDTPAPEYPDDAPQWFKEERPPTEQEFASASPAYKQVAFSWKMQGK